MLVITRREGEEVVIGDPASPIGVVRIASIKGDRVRVAFEFPREVAVHRREVAQQIVDDVKPARVETTPGRSDDAGRAAQAPGRDAQPKPNGVTTPRA
ncbi:MAG: carbon storage regulator [Planctomycetota bacterium]